MRDRRVSNSIKPVASGESEVGVASSHSAIQEANLSKIVVERAEHDDAPPARSLCASPEDCSRGRMGMSDKNVTGCWLNTRNVVPVMDLDCVPRLEVCGHMPTDCIRACYRRTMRIYEVHRINVGHDTRLSA